MAILLLFQRTMLVNRPTGLLSVYWRENDKMEKNSSLPSEQ